MSTYKITRPFQSVSLPGRFSGQRTQKTEQTLYDDRTFMQTEKRTVNVLLVDTHALMLMALMRVVATFPQVKIVRRLQTTEGMSTLLEGAAVDVVVFGVSIPISDCLQFTHSMNERRRELGVIVIQPHLRPETALTLVQQGIHGLLDEFASEQDLANAITTVAAGSTFFSRYARETLNSSMTCQASYLTTRELEVASLLLDGKSNVRIAQALGLKEKTIEAYLTNIYSKLGVKSRVEAIICLQGLQV